MARSTSLDKLMSAAQSGGVAERDGLLTELRPLVCRWAVIWTGSPDTAEDIAQTVLLRVAEALQSFTPSASVATWVYRITKNALIDLDRSRGREHALRDRYRLEQLAKSVAADRGARSFEAVEVLRHLMAKLTARQRAVLDLVDLQGFSPQEAGEMLEVAPATVRVHLHRARQVLRARVEDETSVGGAHG